MAIVGGAIMPLIQGAILDATSPAISFIVPAVCFAVVTSFAVFDLKAVTAQGWRTSMKRFGIVTLALVLAACGGGQKAELLRLDRSARSRVVVGIAVGAPGFRGAAERLQGGEPGRGP